jgi:Predicted ATP-dependent Lon-type protease
MFSSNYGFVVDYLAEILRAMRNHDYSDRYKAHFTLSSDLSTRDMDGINKTFSGLMKILYPQGDASKDEIEEILKFAIEGRKRVKDQLMRIDSTYPKVSFTYEDNVGQVLSVSTLEEEEYPSFYYKTTGDTKNEGGDTVHILADETESISGDSSISSAKVLKEQHRTFQENQKGISYDVLFGPYLRGASQIIITDPYIRLFYQVRNLMEFIESAVKFKSQDEEIAIHLITAEDDFKADHQAESLEK